MRDGNEEGKLYEIREPCFSLPMRDGNGSEEETPIRATAVLAYL